MDYDEGAPLERRILIVDDEPYNVLGMQVTLGRLKIKGIQKLVDRAYNGLEALTILKNGHKNKTHTYGLILTDISMPVMDGYELSEEVRDFYAANYIPQPMIVAVTGHIE